MPDGGGVGEITVTLFYSRVASRKTEHSYSWQRLRDDVLATTQARKEDLPWLKLARFGEKISKNGSLRHDGNLSEITGIEADYDGETVTPRQAIEKLVKAGIRALVYTSPSHREDAPRWRILCPTSGALLPDRRAHLVGRLNGLFGGVLAGESFTLSQAFYFGQVGDNPSHMAELVEGRPIDLCDELDEIWIGRPATKPRKHPAGQQGKADTASLFAAIVSGTGYHQSMRSAGGGLGSRRRHLYGRA